MLHHHGTLLLEEYTEEVLGGKGTFYYLRSHYSPLISIIKDSRRYDSLCCFCSCFFVIVHFFSLIHCYLHLIIRMDTNSKYGFHHWIPELELSYKFLYMTYINRCFKISSTTSFLMQR